MAFEINYFHARVLAEIESWPVDVVADYAHLVELLIEHGQVCARRTLGLLEMVFLNFDPKADQALGERSTVTCKVNGSSSCMLSSRNRNKRLTTI